jgi:hypothetical protein
MSILNFRKTFMAKIQERLNQIDVSTSSDEQLLIAGALIKQLDAVNQINPVSVDTLTIIDNLSGVELDELALDPDSYPHVISIIKNTAIMTVIARSPSTMAAISASAEWIKLINDEATLIPIIVNSNTAMNAIASTWNARTTIANINGPLYTSIKSTNSALAKFIVGYAGLNPANYTNIGELFAVLADVNAIASNTTARELAVSNTILFNIAKDSSMVIAKLIAGSAGLNATDFSDMTALSGNIAAMTAVSTNAAALTILAKSNISLAAVFSSFTNRSLLWNSPNAISILFNFARTYLTSISTEIFFYPGNQPNQLSKKVWIVKVHPTNGSTNGFTSYKCVNGTELVNSLTVQVGAGYDSAAPYLPPSTWGKASALEIYSDYIGAPPNGVRYVYLKMEA